MKKIISIIIACVAITTSATAQKAETVIIKTPTVQCKECKERIEKYVKKEDGITKIKVDYKRKTTTVTYLPSRTNVENIKTSIANVGYDADDVTANEEAYKKLPTCCKKPD